MPSVYGETLVAEDIPVLIAASPGYSALTQCRRDITSVNTGYPWAFLLRGRKGKAERTASLRSELRNMARLAEGAHRKEAIFHELAGDIRNADKGRIIVAR